MTPRTTNNADVVPLTGTAGGCNGFSGLSNRVSGIEHEGGTGSAAVRWKARFFPQIRQANWLAGIALSNPTQRGKSYHALAVAGSNDPEESQSGTSNPAPLRNKATPKDKRLAPPSSPRHGSARPDHPKRHCTATDGPVEPNHDEGRLVPDRSVYLWASPKAGTTPRTVAGKTVATAAGPCLSSKVGQDRIANFGCPHRGGDGVHRWGYVSGKPRYRCTRCRKTFNPLTGTPLAGSHHPERWNDRAAALISGEPPAMAAARRDVHPTTAFRWRHRFPAALNLDKPRPCQEWPRRMRRSFWSPSRANGQIFREHLASGVAKPAGGGCRRSKSRSSSRVSAQARRSTPPA